MALVCVLSSLNKADCSAMWAHTPCGTPMKKRICFSFRQFSFHWLFNFKAIRIPSQTELKIGILAQNGSGMDHLLLHSHLTLRLVTPLARGVCCSNHPQLCALRAGFEALPPLGSSHCFFFHVLMQFAVLSPLTSLGHTSL